MFDDAIAPTSVRIHAYVYLRVPERVFDACVMAAVGLGID